MKNSCDIMIEINDDLKIYFPLKLKPRQQQLDALEFIKKSINTGNKYSIIQASTGSGKSYLTMMFMNWYRNFINSDSKFDILTNSKVLQNQYVNDYQVITPLKGRSNYFCDPHDTNCAIGWETCKAIGPHCGASVCPYEIAKNAWKSSKIGLTNFHMFNTCALYARHILDDRDSNVLIIDEAHEFEENFTSFITFNLNAKQLKKYGFDLKTIEDYDHKLTGIKTISQYINFISRFKEDVKNQIDYLTDQVEKKKSNKKLIKEYSKYVENCNGELTKIEFVLKEYEDDKNNWTLDISKNIKDKMYSGIVLEIKPVIGAKYMCDSIYSSYDHVIFMSATLDKEIFSFMNGLDMNKTTFFNIDSTFPVNNRKIYYMKVGKMSYNEKSDTLKKQLEYIKKILNKYKDKKGIIHTNSYDISKYLQDNLIDKRLLFHDAENREEMLSKHINADYPSVIVSPSMTSGVDFKDDLSRFQIVMKIPYPFISNNVKARQKICTNWYNHVAISELIQSCGRSIRSENDYADTFILDSCLSDLFKYSGKYFPRWFTDSIITLKV